jgi:hypothetical protein
MHKYSGAPGCHLICYCSSQIKTFCMYNCKKKGCVQNVAHNKLVRLKQNQTKWFKSYGMWILLGLLDPEKEIWGTTCPRNEVSHPKILQSSTQLTEPQSYIKEGVSKSQTQHTGAGLLEIDHNQVSTFTTHAKQKPFWYFKIHWTHLPLQLLYSTKWTGMDMELWHNLSICLEGQRTTVRNPRIASLLAKIWTRTSQLRRFVPVWYYKLSYIMFSM